jgi:hypothetical protein
MVYKDNNTNLFIEFSPFCFTIVYIFLIFEAGNFNNLYFKPELNLWQ